jgi:hypothetical protein
LPTLHETRKSSKKRAKVKVGRLTETGVGTKTEGWSGLAMQSDWSDSSDQSDKLDRGEV